MVGAGDDDCRALLALRSEAPVGRRPGKEWEVEFARYFMAPPRGPSAPPPPGVRYAFHAKHRHPGAWLPAAARASLCVSRPSHASSVPVLTVSIGDVVFVRTASLPFPFLSGDVAAYLLCVWSIQFVVRACFGSYLGIGSDIVRRLGASRLVRTLIVNYSESGLFKWLWIVIVRLYAFWKTAWPLCIVHLCTTVGAISVMFHYILFFSLILHMHVAYTSLICKSYWWKELVDAFSTSDLLMFRSEVQAEGCLWFCVCWLMLVFCTSIVSSTGSFQCPA
jgi:hypothetical protein